MKKGFLLAPVAPLNREDSSDSEGVIVKSPEEIGTQSALCELRPAAAAETDSSCLCSGGASSRGGGAGGTSEGCID